MARERIVVGGGSRALKIIGAPKMLAELANAEVVEGLARPTT
jgi:prolyl-tRNA editing enzyme YbaK/EbsC (Cys-tRNA(Pro) deacylase)